MAKKRRSGMADLAHQTAKEVDVILAEREIEVLMNTSIDWESLKPNISDQESLEKLIKAVKEASEHNENIAQLKSRISALGTDVIKVVKKVYKFVK